MKLEQVHKLVAEKIGHDQAKRLWQDAYDLAESVHTSPDNILRFSKILYRRVVKEILTHSEEV